jgi:hypothetical protein
MPPAYADGVLELFALMKAGKLEVVTDTVATVLGRPAVSFESWATRHAAAFR